MYTDIDDSRYKNSCHEIRNGTMKNSWKVTKSRLPVNIWETTKCIFNWKVLTPLRDSLTPVDVVPCQYFSPNSHWSPWLYKRMTFLFSGFHCPLSFSVHFCLKSFSSKFQKLNLCLNTVVAERPSISIDPTPVEDGQNFTVSCFTASNAANLTFVLWKGVTELPPQDSPDFAQVANIKSPSNYTCRVSTDNLITNSSDSMTEVPTSKLSMFFIFQNCFSICLQSVFHMIQFD